MTPKAKAKATLVHYFEQLYLRAGLRWTEEQIKEVESFVDNIVEASSAFHVPTIFTDPPLPEPEIVIADGATQLPTSTLNEVCEELKIVKAQRDRLREAVLLAAKTFKAYGDLHARKLASATDPVARCSISNKAKANFEMAARMEQALIPILTET